MYEIVKTHDDLLGRYESPPILAEFADLRECEMAFGQLLYRWCRANASTDASPADAPYAVRDDQATAYTWEPDGDWPGLRLVAVTP